MRHLRSFLRSRSGNFAVGAALTAVPLVFVVGAVVDLSRGHSARLRLQAAVDGAALAVVKSSGFNPERAREIATQMILASYGPDYRNLSIDLTGSGATVGAEARVSTTFSAILGYRELVEAVSGTVQYPQTRYEIVLVLDTTGSMAGAKIEEMKKAAAAMIDELSATPVLRDRVRFALVPFSGFVNVGADKAKAAWIDRQGLVHLPNGLIPSGVERLKIFANLGTTWEGCVESRIEDGAETYATDDAKPEPARPRSLFMPMLAPDEPGAGRGGRGDYPNSYVEDDTLAGLGVTLEDGRFVYDVVPAALKTASYPFFRNDRTPQGPNYGCDARPIVPLTDDPDGLKSEIAKLAPAGSTNVTEGVAWGQRVLSPGEPFAEGEAPDSDVKKIMVLLTDGDNTITALPNANGSTYSAYGYMADGRWNRSYKKNPDKLTCKQAKPDDDDDDDNDDDDDDDDDDDSHHDSHHDDDDKKAKKTKTKTKTTKVKGCAREPLTAATAGLSAAVTRAMNADTAAACRSAKTAGQEIYAIRLEVATTSSSSLLSNCASSPAHYYDARSASDLEGIFSNIASRIMKLKIVS